MSFRSARLTSLLSVSAIALALAGYTTLHRGEEARHRVPVSAREELLLKTVLAGLSTAHYEPEKLDDAFAGRVYSLYLKGLYKSQRFLLKEDVAQLERQKNQIDDQVKLGSEEFYTLASRLYMARVKEVRGYCDDVLKQPFDFTKDESIELDDDKVAYATSATESREHWRKYLKYQVMAQLADLVAAQEKAKNPIKAAKAEKKPANSATESTLTTLPDADDDATESADVPAAEVKDKSLAQLEADARVKVGKLYTDLFRRMSQQSASDMFSLYINAITNTYDPHTEYFPPKDKANFDIQMTGRLEGIGATLQERDGEIKVAEIVPGSPSYRQGELKSGYVILRVAQGKQEPVSIEGMRLDDAILLIRGKKGTEVRLTVRKPDASQKVISIIRDLVVIQDTYAQSAVIEQADGKRIGYLRLPSFYADFSRSGGRNSGDDVRKEVEKLSAEKVDGIVMDLRNNGGGSLQDAVEMSGLFIPQGPIVQVKSSGGGAQVLADRDSRVQYAGPLVVMVNSYSASASEILAAAMQDYKRAAIVGSSTTYGKGTVQRIFDLDDALGSEFNAVKPFGSLKLTTQKFYRINGGATQLRGVTPDVVLPDMYSYLDQGEKETAYPLAWDEIRAADFQPWSKPVVAAKLKAASQARIAKNDEFRTIDEIAKRLKRQSDNTVRSLKLAEYQKEQAVAKADNKRYEEIEKALPALTIRQLKIDRDAVAKDSIQLARADSFTKKLKKDVYLQEAVNIVRDL
ncbi:MAG: carboxy terminal-processing peptidase [Hymenobacteraceae bacterium]|nr:carboxy terminal-processing peptidase [Hymenobacteraceae bacterium]